MKTFFCLLLLTWSCAAQPLTWADSCRLATTQPRMQAARARVEQARASVYESATYRNPRLNLTAGGNYTTPSVVFQGIPFTANWNYDLGLRLTQLIWSGGPESMRVREREVLADLEAERERDLRLQLQEEAGSTFLSLLKARALQGLRRDQLERQRVSLGLAEQRFRNGTAPRYDVVREQAEFTRCEWELNEARRQETLLRSQLSSLLARPVDELAEPPELEAAGGNPEGRPDVRIARLALDAGAARHEAAERENGPSLSLQADLQQHNAVALSPATQWTTALVFSWPLVDGGLSDARATRLEAEVRELTAQLQETIRVALLQVETERSEVDSRRANLTVTQRQVEAAREAFRIAELRYREGISTQVELLEAQVNLTAAQLQLVEARYDLLTHQLRLRRVLGLEIAQNQEKEP